MDRSVKIKKRIAWTIIIGVAAIIIYAFASIAVQNITAMMQFQKEMSEDVELLKSSYEEASNRHKNMQNAFDELYMQDVELIRLCLYNDFTTQDESIVRHVKNQSDFLEQELYTLNRYYNLYDIMFVDYEGNVVMSATGACADLKDDIFAPLRDENLFETTVVRAVTEEYISTANANGSYDVNFAGLCNFYGAQIGNGYNLVIAVHADDETALEESADGWTVLLQNESIGEQGYVFVWSEKTKKILYHPEGSFKYQNVEALHMDMGKIRDGVFNWNSIDGNETYVYPVYYEEEDVWIACAVTKDEMINSRLYTMIVQGIVFALMAAALAYYVTLLLRQEKIKEISDFNVQKKKLVYHSRQYKLFIITVVISIVMMFLSLYLHTLDPMSSWAASSTSQTSKIQNTVRINKDQVAKFITLYDTAKNAQIFGLSQYIAEHQQAWNSNDISYCAGVMDISYMQLFDDNKKVKAQTSTDDFSIDAEVPAGNFSEQVNLVAEQDSGKDVCDWMSDGRKGMQSIITEDGKVIGYLYTEYYSEAADSTLNYYTFASTLEMVRPGKSGLVFAVDRDNNTFSYYRDENMIGASVFDFGLKENQIKENYCDYINLNNVIYYAITDRIDNNIVFYVVTKERLLSRRIISTTIAVLSAFVLFLMIGIMLYTNKDQIEVTVSESERWRSSEEDNTAEYKIMKIFKYYIVAGALIFSIFSFYRSYVGSGTVLGYVLDGNWEKGINIFAFTSSILILSRGGIVLFFASRLVEALGNVLPIRAGTILKMFASLLTYIVIGVLLYQCMLSFGLNPTALMASTGVIAVVLGIGANSLVGDILAGIFLLLERNVQIGDVVKIGDFRGYVMELGIRMIKLYDMDTEDVKIIPNNDVRNVVHMTLRTASVYSKFQIRYEEKLEDVERILTEELSKVENKSPLILEGPVYIGVSDLGDNGVCLKTATKCHEGSRRKVEREVNHIVYTIFQKHNIEVPYPQVTVHTGDDSMVERKGF